MRLNAEAQLDGEAAGRERRQWLGRLVSLFGILLVLWVVFNLDRIQQWMIAAQTEGEVTADMNWFGPRASMFDALAAELQANLPTADAVEAAIEHPAPVTQYEGYFAITYGREGEGVALVREAPEPEPAPAPEEGAEAMEVERSPRYDFVAVFPEAEVRGTASLRGNSFAADWSSTAVRVDGQYLPASGVVIQQPDGSFDGFGQSSFGETGFSFAAFKISASQ
jgi:hypothetical protein